VKMILQDLKMITVVFRSLILMTFIFNARAHASSCGSLAAVQGNVDVLRNQMKAGEDATRFVVNGKNFLALECDDIVVTRGQSVAKIILANGKISMGPDSRIEIAGVSGPSAKPDVALVNLAYGKVRALIQKKAKETETETEETTRGPQSSFSIKTHTAVAGVRGTDFFVSYDPNSFATDQATLTGKVEVEQKETGQKVLVSAGQQVAVGAPVATQKKEVEELAQKPKPMRVIAIQESTKHDLRIASAVSKGDKDFTSTEAVKILGAPTAWTIEKEVVPSKYKDLKNEF
jgi:hypothetical protein